MGKRLKAVGHGIGHFFRNRVDHTHLWRRGKKMRESNAYTMDEIAVIIALYGIHKHSIGIATGLVESVRSGIWTYKSLKEVENDAYDVLENTNLSEDAKKKAMKLLKKGELGNYEQFSSADADELRGVYLEMCQAAGQCVNF